jgi:hypothetical protein
MQEAFMRGPILMANGGAGLHALTRKFAAEVVVSSLATLLVMSIFANATKPAAPVAQDPRQQDLRQAAPAAGAAKESLDDFMERVALSHVAALKAPPAADESAPVAPAAAQKQAAQRHDRPHSDKLRVAAVKAPPLAEPARPQQGQDAGPAAAAPAAGVDWLMPVKYGMRLVGTVQDVVSASSTRVVESVASVGGVLTSFVKKPQS